MPNSNVETSPQDAESDSTRSTLSAEPVASLTSRLGGWLLRGGIAVLLLLRRPRPIHSRGAVFEGEMTALRRGATSGIGWIDDPPDGPVTIVARVSRSVGLPSLLPDVYGIGIRWEHDGAPVDLQLSSTGIGFPGRYLLMPRLTLSRAVLSSVLPYRTARGPVLLCARTVPARRLPGDLAALRQSVDEKPWTLRLYFASPRGKWHPFADARLSRSRPDDDPDLRFDIDTNPLPGAATYPWVRALRQPSYRLSQRG
ncbi:MULTISPECIES: hypothetical protein [unclassified Microbacterium]|uniref:hypothetical protein n=1 Tax=unclassified Microbacterium TaxID=2609290 RepID=UPI000EAA69ED|nr:MULTISPECIES: hypothetical protein [unclassified Microbacterium]MBT2484332.1 hypothetical protein [Microbacterium sp. ISL-108]RKN67249.1 hypothetical protein D7252_06450 [Microbacterium sp. CGR2]